MNTSQCWQVAEILAVRMWTSVVICCVPDDTISSIVTYVLAVGGSTLQASPEGFFESEVVWNGDIGAATGGGVSQYFAEPFYQRSLPHSDQKQLAGRRGIPDVAFNAELIYTYVSFYPDPTYNGFQLNGGTSEAAPAWAGVMAVANQLAGRSLGFVHPRLYRLGALGEQSAFFHDVTTDNNATNGLPATVRQRGGIRLQDGDRPI